MVVSEPKSTCYLFKILSNDDITDALFFNLGDPEVFKPTEAPHEPDEIATQVPPKPSNATLQSPDETPAEIPPKPVNNAAQQPPKKPVLLSQLPKKPDGPNSRFRRTTYMKNRGRLPSYEKGMLVTVNMLHTQENGNTQISYYLEQY
jgi:hypothetical protein